MTCVLPGTHVPDSTIENSVEFKNEFIELEKQGLLKSNALKEVFRQYSAKDVN